ncbi:MAG TPA: hypothetical protein VLJ58_21440 [Ramlibacter sp.]|nr:hypothetical protein [Ramlibacter sp.]
MTVSSTARSAGPFVGNGVTTSFAFAFKVFSSNDLEVSHTSSAGAVTVLTLDTHYTVALNANQDTNPGGTVTYPISGTPLASPATLAIVGDQAYEQTLDISNVGRFLAQAVENALDKSAIMAQQLLELLSRTLRYPAGDSASGTLPSATQRAGKYLAFDAESEPVASAGTGNDSALRTDLAASTGSSLLGFIQAGTGAVAETLQAKAREQVSVFDFMTQAQKDDVRAGTMLIDVTAAIQLAIVYAGSVLSGKQVAIHFPAGVYRVSDGVLNTAALKQGARFTGDGWYSSVLRFGTLAGAAYMFNNGASERIQFPVFENLGFEGTTPTLYEAGTIPAFANFIRQWSAGSTQGFKFISCRFAGFDKMFLCEGSNTASENRWVNCKISHVQNYVLGLNNAQSLNHEFIGTDIEVILGDIFQIQAGGGGSIKVFGGSIIPSGTGSCAVLRLSGSLISHGVALYGARIELRSASVLAVMPNGNLGKMTLNACSVYNTVSSGSRDIVSVGSFGVVDFVGCEFPSNGATSTYRLTATGQFGESGRITWESCQVPSGLSDNISFASSYGRASANACHPMDYGAVSAEPFITAIDFDLGATGSYDIAGYRDAGARVKRVWLKAANTIWPKSNGAGGSANDLTVKLPKNAVLKAVVLRKNAGGSSAAGYQLQVTNNDVTTTHATSNNDQQQLAHTITEDNLFVELGSTTNDRTIRVSVTGASTGNQNLSGGFGYIEYI